jgi:RanBP1 domain
VTLVTPDMRLSPNVGSDRSWVWNVAADVSEGEPEAQTLAIRFANSDSEFDLIATISFTADPECRCQRIQGSFPQGSARKRGAVWSRLEDEQHWSCRCLTPPFTTKQHLPLGAKDEEGVHEQPSGLAISG